jgi:hypothetical protein
VALDPATVLAAREHRERQTAEQLLIAAGWKVTAWCSAASMVACRALGSSREPSSTVRTSLACHRFDSTI